MAWEYMEELDYRYELASKALGNTKRLHVVELCCGNGRFKDYLQGFKSYRGNDLRQVDNKYYSSKPDELFVEEVKKCDVLAVFGHGGFEIDKNPLESSTLTQSFLTLVSRFGPKYLVLESIEKYSPIIDGIISALLPYYTIISVHNTDGNDWLSKRQLRVLKLLK